MECLANMAVASGTDEHWRPLNHAVLMATRSESVWTKLTALEVGGQRDAPGWGCDGVAWM